MNKGFNAGLLGALMGESINQSIQSMANPSLGMDSLISLPYI